MIFALMDESDPNGTPLIGLIVDLDSFSLGSNCFRHYCRSVSAADAASAARWYAVLQDGRFPVPTAAAAAATYASSAAAARRPAATTSVPAQSHVHATSASTYGTRRPQSLWAGILRTATATASSSAATTTTTGSRRRNATQQQ